MSTVLPILDMSRPSRKVMGDLGEAYAAYLLQLSGYIVTHIRQADLAATNPATGELLRVEVKTAQRRPDRKYVFQLWNPGTDYRHSDRVLLLAIQPSRYPVPFIIPTDKITFRSTIVITSHPLRYAGMWAEYRQNTGVITL